MKNSPDGYSSRLHAGEERIRDLQDEQTEAQRENRLKGKNE